VAPGRRRAPPGPRPTLREALRDTYLATAHTVTQVTQDAERMVYPQFRARDAIAGHPADAFSLPMSPSALR
jgi:hypothetical protein